MLGDYFTPPTSRSNLPAAVANPKNQIQIWIWGFPPLFPNRSQIFFRAGWPSEGPGWWEIILTPYLIRTHPQNPEIPAIDRLENQIRIWPYKKLTLILAL